MKAFEQVAHPQFENGMQFVVVSVEGEGLLFLDEVVTLQENDKSNCPFFTNASGERVCLYWSQLTLLEAMEDKEYPGIPVGTKFVTLKGCGREFNVGEIVTLVEQDKSSCPGFEKADGSDYHYTSWKNVAPLYAPEVKEETLGDYAHFEYPVGTQFKMVTGSHHYFPEGTLLTLKHNDSSRCPLFVNTLGADSYVNWSRLVLHVEAPVTLSGSSPTVMIPDDIPSHYAIGGMDPNAYLKMKLTREEYIGYLKGQAIKYLSRAGRKGAAAQDYSKANYYTDRLVKEVV